MLFIIPIIIAMAATGCYLLALVSDGFAYELSRVVEALFEAIEYRAARRQSQQREYTARTERLAYRRLTDVAF